METRYNISLKRWEDIDTMFEKTDFFKPIPKMFFGNPSRRKPSLAPSLSFENVGEQMKSFMHNN